MPSGRKTPGLSGRAGEQVLGDGTGDDGAEAEAADGDAGDEPPLVGEPLREHGDRRDVRQAQADAAHDAVGEDEQPQLVLVFTSDASMIPTE